MNTSLIQIGLKKIALVLTLILLGYPTILAAQDIRFQADFENGTTPQIGTANYNLSAVTAVALQVPITNGPDSTLGNSVLLLESNHEGPLAARFDFDSAATLESNSVKISFDLAARRINGKDRTTLLSGYSSQNQKVFSLVLGDSDAFGNSNRDRQRPGYETSTVNQAILPGHDSPKAFWWGADTDPAAFDASKDAHFNLTIQSDGWFVSTTKRNGISFSSDKLPHYDDKAHLNLAYLTLKTETGSGFGQYWDNLIVRGFPDNATLDTYYWTGDEDGKSLFQEDNWNSKKDESGNQISTIGAAKPVNAHLIIDNGNVGGEGVSGELDLGLGSLHMSGGTLKFAKKNGITGGDLSIKNSTTLLEAEHILDSELEASAEATIALTGAFTEYPYH